MIKVIAQTNFVHPNEGCHLLCNEITVRMKLHEASDNSNCTYRGCQLIEFYPQRQSQLPIPDVRCGSKFPSLYSARPLVTVHNSPRSGSKIPLLWGLGQKRERPSIFRREARRKRLRRAQRRLFIADAGGSQLVATALPAATDWERRHLGGA